MNKSPWIPVVLYFGLILALSSIPARQLPETGISFADKPAHLAVYSLLGFLLGRTEKKFLCLLGLGILLGAIDESYQGLIPGRNPDFWDLAADGCGIALGLSASGWLRARKPAAGPSPP